MSAFWYRVLLYSQIGLLLVILLPSFAKSCEHRHAPPEPAQGLFLITKMLPTVIVRLSQRGKVHSCGTWLSLCIDSQEFLWLNLPCIFLLSLNYVGSCRFVTSWAFSMYLMVLGFIWSFWPSRIWERWLSSPGPLHKVSSVLSFVKPWSLASESQPRCCFQINTQNTVSSFN